MKKDFRVLTNKMSKEKTKAVLNAKITSGKSYYKMTIREGRYPLSEIIYRSVLSHKKTGKSFYSNPIILNNFSFSKIQDKKYQARYNIRNITTRQDDLFVVEIITKDSLRFDSSKISQLFSFLYNGFFMTDDEINDFKGKFLK